MTAAAKLSDAMLEPFDDELDTMFHESGNLVIEKKDFIHASCSENTKYKPRNGSFSEEREREREKAQNSKTGGSNKRFSI